ncbi:MAG: hypothetical protein JXA25_07830 [Anaerolineales bacterium]|nr:hypothetical protein [Anaerolineales bacterium]
MNILNIGGLELTFIIVLALIIMGPNDIVRSARTAAQWVKKIKSNRYWQEILRTTSEIRDLPNKIMAESGLEEAVQSMNLLSQNLQHDLRSEVSLHPRSSITLRDHNAVQNYTEKKDITEEISKS